MHIKNITLGNLKQNITQVNLDNPLKHNFPPASTLNCLDHYADNTTFHTPIKFTANEEDEGDEKKLIKSTHTIHDQPISKWDSIVASIKKKLTMRKRLNTIATEYNQTRKSTPLFQRIKTALSRTSMKIVPENPTNTTLSTFRSNKTLINKRPQLSRLSTVVGYLRVLRSKKKDETLTGINKPALTPEEIKHIFKRAFDKIRTIYRLKLIYEDIVLYGTSSNLFDLTTRDRRKVKSIIYPSFDITEDKTSTITIRWYILHPKSRFRLIWAMLLVLMLFYTVIMTPYILAFIEDDSEWLLIDYIINFLYWFDILINFFSAYYTEEGLLETNLKVISISYIKSWFLIDLVSCFPFELIGAWFDNESDYNIFSKKHASTKIARLTRIPKLYRLLRLAKIIKLVKVVKHDNHKFVIDFSSAYFRLLIFGIQVCLLIHIMGCLWFFIDKVDDFNPDTWVIRMNLFQDDNFSLYIASIYYIVTTLVTVGYGDITSFTPKERIFSIFWTVIGVGFYSFTIGILTSNFTSKWDRESSLKRKLAIMDEFAREIKAPKKLKNKIKRILEYNSVRNCFSWADKKGVFDEIPINLRYEVVMNMQGKILADIPFFREHGDKYFIVKIAQLLKPMTVKTNNLIWLEGTSPDAFYFLVRGRVNYISYEILDTKDSKEPKKTPIVFKKMIPGSYFGEIEIILRTKRFHTLQASCDSELFYISRYDFDNVIAAEFPHIIKEMSEIALERQKRNAKALKDLRKFIQKLQADKKKPVIKKEKLDPKASLSNIDRHTRSKRICTTFTQTLIQKSLANKALTSNYDINTTIATNITTITTTTNANMNTNTNDINNNSIKPCMEVNQTIEEEKSQLHSSREKGTKELFKKKSTSRSFSSSSSSNSSSLSSSSLSFESICEEEKKEEKKTKKVNVAIPRAFYKRNNYKMMKNPRKNSTQKIKRINSLSKRMSFYKRNRALTAAGTVLNIDADWERKPSIEKSFLRRILAGFKSRNNSPKNTIIKNRRSIRRNSRVTFDLKMMKPKGKKAKEVNIKEESEIQEITKSSKTDNNVTAVIDDNNNSKNDNLIGSNNENNTSLKEGIADFKILARKITFTEDCSIQKDIDNANNTNANNEKVI